MLVYLDNARASALTRWPPNARNGGTRQSKNPKAPEGLNENYARELMELHTLGVNGGYTQADVTQVARVLTGWTVDRRSAARVHIQSQPPRAGHEKVMGQKIKENGEMEGRELLHMLATSPATAQFISRKLAMRFVRRSAAEPGRPHGKVVSLQRRRHFRGAEDSVPLARVLVRKRCLSRQGQDAHRVCGFRGARQQRRRRQLSAAGQRSFARWGCRSTARSRPPATTGKRPRGSARERWWTA
jgi:hypothetical protein